MGGTERMTMNAFETAWVVLKDYDPDMPPPSEYSSTGQGYDEDKPEIPIPRGRVGPEPMGSQDFFRFTGPELKQMVEAILAELDRRAAKGGSPGGPSPDTPNISRPGQTMGLPAPDDVVSRLKQSGHLGQDF